MTDQTPAPDSPDHPDHPDHHRHAAEAAPRNPWKIVAITLAVLVGIALVVWITLAVTGNPAPGPTPTPSPTPTHSDTPTPTPTPTPTAAGPCTTDNSTTELGAPSGAAGSTQVPLIFTNTSDAACTLEGYPTVEFVGDGNGTQIGATAMQDASTVVALVTIEPGNSAMATLTITDAANVDDCSPVTPDGFRVIPPGSNDAFFIEVTDYQACENAAVSILAVSAIATN